MDKKLLIDQYLQGKHPIDGESWELPTADELDRDEALYDALLAERPSKSPLKGDFTSILRGGRTGSWGQLGRWALGAAAAVVLVAALFTWKSFKPQNPSQQVKTTAKLAPQENTPKAVEKCTVEETPTLHGGKPNAPRRKARRPTMHFDTPQPVVAEAVSKSTDTVVLTNAADSLYYYLTILENQMGDCRDSTCLAELTGLMKADERIKSLVNKIIHKQVESAYQEEYLVDTTTRYVPL